MFSQGRCRFRGAEVKPCATGMMDEDWMGGWIEAGEAVVITVGRGASLKVNVWRVGRAAKVEKWVDKPAALNAVDVSLQYTDTDAAIGDVGHVARISEPCHKTTTHYHALEPAQRLTCTEALSGAHHLLIQQPRGVLCRPLELLPSRHRCSRIISASIPASNTVVSHCDQCCPLRIT